MREHLVEGAEAQQRLQDTAVVDVNLGTLDEAPADVGEVRRQTELNRWAKSFDPTPAVIKRFLLRTLETGQRQRALISTSESMMPRANPHFAPVTSNFLP